MGVKSAAAQKMVCLILIKFGWYFGGVYLTFQYALILF